MIQYGYLGIVTSLPNRWILPSHRVSRFFMIFLHVFAGLMKFAMICDIKEKWKAIAGHVGTRDVRACADRFKAPFGAPDGRRHIHGFGHGRCVVNVRWSNRGRWRNRKRRNGGERLQSSFRLLTFYYSIQ